MKCSVEDLYDSFRARLRAIVAARTGDEALAEDLVQDAFVKLAGYCEGGGSCDHPKAFALRITMNLLADHFRGKAKLDSAAQPPTHAQPEEQDNLNEEFMRCFKPLLDQLPEPYREAVRLADVEQVPLKDMAARLGISISCAKSRVQRGRSRLRESVHRMCEIEHDRYGNVLRCEARRRPTPCR